MMLFDRPKFLLVPMHQNYKPDLIGFRSKDNYQNLIEYLQANAKVPLEVDVLGAFSFLATEHGIGTGVYRLHTSNQLYTEQEIKSFAKNRFQLLADRIGWIRTQEPIQLYKDKSNNTIKWI